jgi:hypothetical protein
MKFIKLIFSEFFTMIVDTNLIVIIFLIPFLTVMCTIILKYFVIK